MVKLSFARTAANLVPISSDEVNGYGDNQGRQADDNGGEDCIQEIKARIRMLEAYYDCCYGPNEGIRYQSDQYDCFVSHQTDYEWAQNTPETHGDKGTISSASNGITREDS